MKILDMISKWASLFISALATTSTDFNREEGSYGKHECALIIVKSSIALARFVGVEIGLSGVFCRK